MDERALPGQLPVGAQLGVGIRSSSLYIPSQNKNDQQAKWIDYCDDSFSTDFSKLRIVGKGSMINDKSSTPPRVGPVEEEYVDSDYIYDFDDEETYEHWRNALVTKLNWSNLSPVFPSNLQLFKDVEFNDNHMYDVRHKLTISPHDYVPESLIKDLTEKDLFSAPHFISPRKKEVLLTLDPTIGDLHATGDIQTVSDLRNGINQHSIIAYSSGKTGSILKVAVLHTERPKTGAPLSKVVIREFTCIELRSTIKSIKIPQLSTLLGRHSDFIGVLTENALHIIKLESVDPHSLKINASVCDALPFIEFGDFPFADFAFNPWDLQQFAIVDIQGNYGVGRIPKSCKRGSKIRLVKGVGGNIFDPEELSNWKKIEWSSSYTRLLIMARSRMVELDFEQDWQLDVIQAKTWSSLRDYQRLDDDFGILLTSQEIIILSTKKKNEHIVREMSWKHDLDSTDQTLRLSVQKIPMDEKILVMTCVFSKCHNKVYIHGFSIQNHGCLLQSIGDSTIVQIPRIEKGVLGISSSPIRDSSSTEDYKIVDEDIFNKIWLNMFVSDNKSKKLRHYILTDHQDNEIRDSPHVHFDRLEDKAPSKENDFQMVDNIRPIVERIKNIKLSSKHLKFISSQEDEIFQDYGYRLSEAMNRVIASWDSGAVDMLTVQPLLKDITETPEYFESLEEFNSFLHQFFDHYEDQGIAFTKFSTISNLLLQECIDDPDVFYNKLLQCWDLVTGNSEFLTRELVKSIHRSVITVCKPSSYETLETQLCESLSEPYREILGIWDDEDVQDGNTNDVSHANSQSQLPTSSQSQIPIIKSSQSRPQKKVRRGGINSTARRQLKASANALPSQGEVEISPSALSSSQISSTLPDTMTPAFTLMQPTSQSQSSQRTRKKKKRVGGFG